MIKEPLDWKTKAIVDIYDEAPLWSVKIGLLLLENIPMQPQQTVMDLGFGTGFPLIELAQRFGKGSKIIGIDKWLPAIHRAKRKATLLGLKNIEFQNCSVNEFDVKEGTVDLVCSNMGINNFENLDKVLFKIHDALKIGGHFCFTTNDVRTFNELNPMFIRAMRKLKINPIQLTESIYSRQQIESLKNSILNMGFHFSKQLQTVNNYRFCDAEAVFNHSIIRIAFLESWKMLVPPSKWYNFLSFILDEIEELIKANGVFHLTVPLYFLDFEKRG